MAIQSHLRAHRMEQITGIEPASSAWEADILTIVLYLQHYYYTEFRKKIQVFFYYISVKKKAGSSGNFDISHKARVLSVQVKYSLHVSMISLVASVKQGLIIIRYMVKCNRYADICVVHPLKALIPMCGHINSPYCLYLRV